MTTAQKSVLTHWKENFNYDYLGAYSITGNSVIGTIKLVQKGMVKGAKGKEQECTICYFTDLPKPMILNKTNCKIIQNLYGTPFIEEWKGKRIELIKAIVDAFGESTEALRVKPIIPSSQKKKITKEGLIKAIQAIKNKTFTKEKLLNGYDLNEDQLKTLKEALI